MSDSEGLKLEFTVKQAAAASLVLGLLLGGIGGLAAGTALSSPDAQKSPGSQDTDSQNTDSSDGSDDSGTELVSLDGIELEGEPSMGESDAPIKVVEYTDYGCPFCAEWQGVDTSGRIPIDQMNIGDSLKNQYVDTGEVEFIMKDYPVPNLHPNGPEAHKAANCVYENEEDSYWDFHDEIFERRDSWMEGGSPGPKETFRSISNDLGLDTDKVMECYENSNNSEADQDKSNALKNLGRLGTPAFFVGNKETGFVEISGAQPISRFEQAINTVKSQ